MIFVSHTVGAFLSYQERGWLGKIWSYAGEEPGVLLS